MLTDLSLLAVQDWSDELLAQECCEEVFVVVPIAMTECQSVCSNTRMEELGSTSSVSFATRVGSSVSGIGRSTSTDSIPEVGPLARISVVHEDGGAVRYGSDSVITATGHPRRRASRFGLGESVTGAAAFARRRVLLRGLRLKVGLDVGRSTPDLNVDTGGYWSLKFTAHQSLPVYISGWGSALSMQSPVRVSL